jgi:hypothetical protein
MRKFIIGLGSAAIVAALALPVLSSDVSARGWGHGGGHRGGGWHGGGGWRGGGWGYRGYGYGYPYYAGYYGYNCWRSVRVGTPYGWTWRRVWVCG